MKTNSFPKLIISFFALMFFISCESHEQRADDAFESYKEEKKSKRDSDVMIAEIIEAPKPIKIAKKAESTDEWTKFKTETEKQIVANENVIKIIKNTPNSNAKLLRKLARLERDNNDLHSQMDNYNIEVKIKWEKFKSKINQNVTEIDSVLKDLAINTKK